MDMQFFIVVDGKKYFERDCGRLGVSLSVSCDPVENGMRYTPAIRNDADHDLTIHAWGAELTGFANAGADWTIYIDSGHIGDSGVKRLFATDAELSITSEPHLVLEDADWEAKADRSNMDTVLWDRANRQGTLIGFSLQREGANYVSVFPDESGLGVQWASAHQILDRRLAPGECCATDQLVITAGRDPYALLEGYADIVHAAHGKSFAMAPLVGMLSWYGYRSAITEELITDRADIISELFGGYPQPMRPTMIVDHGWQHDACWGNFRPDENRFSHGIRWLHDEMEKRGLALGLWHTPFFLSWNAPNKEELEPLEFRDPEGNPLEYDCPVWGALPGHVRDKYPIWVLDGGSEDVQERWSSEFAQMKEWGVAYVKIDFFTLLANAEHNINQADLYKKTWANFCKNGGEDMLMAPCSCLLNKNVGFCDSISCCPDMGNAGFWPDTKKNRFFYNHTTMGSQWYKHRRFWVNNADAAQVGRGCSLNEARMRLTTAAMSGGHFMVGDDIGRLDAQRLEMIRRMLPATPYAARPITMFDQPLPDPSADIWELILDTSSGRQTTLALFNMAQEECEFNISPEMFGYAPGTEITVLEWWGCKWLGNSADTMKVRVPAEDVYVLHAVAHTEVPTVFSTSHHFAGGYILENIRFDAEKRLLSGDVVTKPGLNIVLFGMCAGYRLTPQEGFHAVENSLGGFQKELTTTAQRTPFEVQFVV